MNKIDVFISRKSADAKFAKAIYDYLTLQGLVVFDSEHTLKEIGNADYIKAIDEALTTTTHMIVVGSSLENIKSSWVEAEWLFYLNRKRSGKTSGNLFTVITGNFKVEDVPPSLANYEVIPYNEKNFPIIYNYVRQENSASKSAPKKPFPAGKQNKYLWGFIGILIAGVLGATIYLRSQPFDATVFLKPDPSLKLQSNYPAFKGGELSIYINNKEEKKEILSNGEVVFKQLAASSKGEKVAIKIISDNWQLETDSIFLGKVVNLKIVPDGSLAVITGNIKNNSGETIENVNIRIGNDTTIASDNNGIFNIMLPAKFQKSNYILLFQKDGYQPLKEYYYPKSGNIDIRLKKLY
jgi:hypothetical protein